MLQCISDDVVVNFVEPGRNWRGKKTARSKFEGWFANCPDVSVDWELTSSAVAEDGSIDVVLLCDFGSGKHGMGYVVRDA